VIAYGNADTWRMRDDRQENVGLSVPHGVRHQLADQQQGVVGEFRRHTGGVLGHVAAGDLRRGLVSGQCEGNPGRFAARIRPGRFG
jgi:hypothetical protein